MTAPFLSIVIANFNYGRFLSEAIDSVLSQSCQDFELIICDGGSTDDSVEVIHRYEDRLSWWCSEKDKGQSDAFNKGFSHACGRFLTWLNADDVLLPGTIERLKNAVEKCPGCEWFVGGVLWLDPEMRVVNCGRGRPFSEIRYREGNVSTWGPSSFFTKRLLNSVGGVDIRFQYAMDSDLWLRFAYKAHARYLPFCDYAWGLRLHPNAKMSGHNFTTEGTLDVGHREREKIKRSRHLAQLNREGAWMREYFSPHKASLFSRIVSASWIRVLQARLDLLQWKGLHYSEIFT